MSKEKQIEEKVCKNCIHYQMCVDTFRKAKQDGEYLLIDEDFYFAHTDGCDFYADKRTYRKQSEGEWIAKDNFNGRCTIAICSNCGTEKAFPVLVSIDTIGTLYPYCQKCGAKMKGGAE